METIISKKMGFYVFRINTVAADALFFHLFSSLLSSVNVLLSSVRSFEIDFFFSCTRHRHKNRLKDSKEKAKLSEAFLLIVVISLSRSLSISVFVYLKLLFFLVHSIVVNVITAEWQ